MENIILKNVTEYGEGFDVTLEMKSVDIENENGKEERVKKLCVVAVNEGGYNSVSIDAEQLYNALKKIYEN